ncbi:hypothetical protein X275_00155 [Marinitoga sp. 1197]|nr:hypothetical protein X274_03940 [Marinitoga sp. 1155]KLO24466.1 hypothetical protein X275_00155 [Marinitoga sp. 1197]
MSFFQKWKMRCPIIRFIERLRMKKIKVKIGKIK